MFRTFIQVFALLLALLASGFWIRSAIILRDNDVATLSQTMWNYNLEVAKNLCHQRSDALIAVVLLLSSAICQIVNLLWPMRICDFAVDMRGVFLAVVVFILAWIVAWVGSERLYATQFHRVEIILKATK